jgi:hypothetical protein
MRLGQLVDELKKFNLNYPVVTKYYGETVNLGDISSYRGYYDHVALVPTTNDFNTVGTLIAQLEEALNGKEFTGYKGGEFTYNSKTPVWASKWGNASQLKVTGLTYQDNQIWINTFLEEDY